MKSGGKRPAAERALRREAERRLDGAAAGPAASEELEAARLLHELQVHQLELEMQHAELEAQNLALERAKRETESALDRYFELYDFAPVGYFTLEPSGTIVAANLAGAALLGSDRSRLIGRHFADFVARESRPAFGALLARLGSSAARADADLTLGIDGPDHRSVHLLGARAEEAGGRRPEFRMAAIDISARLAAEREREVLRARLAKAERLESVGRLAGGVAHEVNNMLGVILGFAEIGLGRIESSNPLFSDLMSIRDAAERVAALTGRLLAFASRQPIRPRRLELDPTIETLLPVLRRALGEKIELEFRPQGGLWPIRVDSRQIDQILAELAINARHAIGEEGRLTLRTENAVVDADRPGEGPVAGQYVCLTVQDDGAGMDETTVRRLFEPFFTTREVGQGAGLGLASIYGIVRQNGGYAEVESAPGAGTCFRLYFPRFAGEPALAAAPPAAGEPERCVLVVEDEPAFLFLITTMLEQLGYRTLAAGSPSAALQLAARNPGRIDLLLTDVVMPEMNGRELAGRLAAFEPEVPCIYMSGHPVDVVSGEGLLGSEAPFLQKPFSIAALASKIIEALRTGTSE